MSKLIVVSNRLPGLQPSTQDYSEPEVPAGGLVSALLGFLARAPGSQWVGWNGRVHPEAHRQRTTRRTVRGVDLIGFPLSPAEMDDHYLGFCNGALWPLLHCFQSKVRIRIRQEQRYNDVQDRFARILLPLLDLDDLVWVHDYHLLLLAQALRRLGWRGRLGFFLHTPFPPHELWQLLPRAREVLAGLLEYDVIGFHVQSFLDNYINACRRELGAAWDGGFLTSGGRIQRAGIYPVGIDPGDFEQPPAPAGASSEIRPLRGPRLVLGVDRLDYTKGIPERVLALESFLERYEQWRRKVIYVQIAAPSRTQVPEYRRQKRRVDSLVGRVNGKFGAPNWVPIHYLYRTYSHRLLARLYRRAEVCLVTPLRDGMNLVAKEFIAAQDPRRPGVLIMSRCAGAAQELKEALIVNPYVPSDVADGLAAALTMPHAERVERHAALLARIRTTTASTWGRRFVADLKSLPTGARSLQWWDGSGSGERELDQTGSGPASRS